MSSRILVVDSDRAVTGLLRNALTLHGFDVLAAASGTEAVAAAGGPAVRPDLVIVNAALPDADGLDVLRRLRDEAPGVGAIVLTPGDCTDERVRALAAGGDDCVGTPFAVDELVARVGAVLRRAANGHASTSRLVFADLELDESTREVWRDRAPVRLTATEFNLLRYLLLNQGLIVSKNQILDRLWPHEFHRRRQRRRDVHQLSPAQARPQPPATDPHRARRRVCPAPARVTPRSEETPRKARWRSQARWGG